MTLYTAFNSAFESSVTTMTAGGSYATGAKVAIQLNVPDNAVIRIVEFGWTQDVATSTATLLELATTDTASTVTTAATSKPLIDRDARATSLTQSTTTSGYGTGTITSQITLRYIAKLYVPQQYVMQYPLGQWPIVGSAAAENFVQLRVNTTATVNGSCWITWDEA